MVASKVTADVIRAMKGRKPIAALTAYDYPMAVLLDEAEVPLVLVGDSVGVVVLGYPDTTSVTMEEMEHHVRAVARAQPRGLVAADLPYGTCRTVSSAQQNAHRLIQAGAEAVKAEGGLEIQAQAAGIVSEGIPFLGHLGMLPQTVRQEGGYHVKGKTETERRGLMAGAAALEEAGAFAIVLELVKPVVAWEITKQLTIPTIGIGSGPDCDGQVLVTTDLLGTSPGYIPKHVKQHANFGESMRQTIKAWKQNLTNRRKN